MTLAITRSDARSAQPEPIRLGDEVAVTSLGAVNVNDTAFLPAGVRVDAPGLTVYIDPLRVDDPRPADLILLTHDHGDHLSPPDLARLAGPDTVIVGPASVVSALSNFKVRQVAPGDRGAVGAVQYQAIAAYNTAPVLLWLEAHPRAARNVGYVLSVGGQRIYHAGDSDFVPEMRELKDITLALVPIGGGHLTMDPEQAAAAINAIRPAIATPLHYSIGPQDGLARFAALVDSEIRVQRFAP